MLEKNPICSPVQNKNIASQTTCRSKSNFNYSLQEKHKVYFQREEARAFILVSFPQSVQELWVNF